MNTDNPVHGLTNPQTEALIAFLSNLYKAANDRETVEIGGGTFNPKELRTVYGAIITTMALANINKESTR